LGAPFGEPPFLCANRITKDMADFFSYDPLKGVTKYFDYDEMTGDAFIRTEQDVEPLLRETMENRNTGSQESPRKDFKLYASIPPVVQLELRKKGIDIYSKDPSMIRKMLQTINREYPYLKSTWKVHE
jgi:hypothetical protein